MTNVINYKGEAMRKFLLAAALFSVAACGDKAKDAGTTTPPAAPTATAPDSNAKKDSGSMGNMPMGKDSGMKKDSGTMAPKKP